MNYEMVDIIAEAEKVVVPYSWTGTPVEVIAGVSPTGKKLEHKGTAIYYFDNNQVIKIWDVWDRYSVLKQLALIP
jgi:predicted ester cyclase